MNSAAALAAHIAEDFLKQPVRDVTPIVGKGSQNRIFVVTAAAAAARVVVRMNDDPAAFRTYQKERWCLEQAGARGIPGPKALALGQVDGRPYLLQTWIEGVNGQDSPADKASLWSQVGQCIRRVHEIPVGGFGEDLDDLTHGGRPGETWLRFVDYNIDSLNDDDALRRLGVLTADQSERVRSVFRALREREFRFGLNHGDISLRNIVVEPSGRVSLLDWGCAEAHIVPHYDLIRMDEQPCFDETARHAFLDGYGLSLPEFAAMQPELSDLALLKAFDLTRWAIDRNPPLIQKHAARARKLLEKALRR